MGLAKIEYSNWKIFVCLLFLANITINVFVSKKKNRISTKLCKGGYCVLARQISGFKNIKDVETEKGQIGYKEKDILVMKDVNKIVVIQFF